MTTCGLPSGFEGAWPVLVPAPGPGGSPGPGPGHIPRHPQPTFSVVIAAYQAEDTIGDAIESVLVQTRAADEIVVCDDGSTDATAAALEPFTDRVRLLHQPNKGEGAAKNAAVRAATGEYVVVLDADDVFHPRRLEALEWLVVRRPDLDVLTTDADVEANGQVVRGAYHEHWRFEIEDQRQGILDRNFVLGMAAVRRDRWLEVGGFDEDLRYTADWEFWQRLVLSGSRVGMVNARLATYRLAPGSLSSNREALVEARLKTLRRAAGRADLTAAERRTVTMAIRRERRELALRQVRTRLSAGRKQVRGPAVTVLLAPGVHIRTRAKALGAFLFPRLARAMLRRTPPATVEIGSGIRVPAPVENPTRTDRAG